MPENTQEGRQGTDVAERIVVRRGRVGSALEGPDPFVTTEVTEVSKTVPRVLARSTTPAPSPPVPASDAIAVSGPSGGLGTAAVLIFVVGTWGGLVPFLGPIFGFSADGSPSWTWNLSHVLLWVVPGAAAVLGAVGSMGLMGRFTRGKGRVGAAGAGVVVTLSGAWFVMGPVSWPVFERSAGVFVPAPPLRELSYQVGYSLGPGILLVLLGGMLLGWALRGGRVPARRAVDRHRAAT